jgi:Domain of unknown function (DUF3362)
MYYTGIDPFTGETVATATKLNDRKMQRALLQFFKPENYCEVRKALLEAGRGNLIGSGCDSLIPARPPRMALQARREFANKSLSEGRYVHTILPEPGPKSATKSPAAAGYRPNRKTARRRPHD